MLHVCWFTFQGVLSLKVLRKIARQANVAHAAALFFSQIVPPDVVVFQCCGVVSL